MSIEQAKLTILEEAGFNHQFDMSVYFNRDLKKFFSEEAVTDHIVEWLRTTLLEDNDCRSSS